MKTYRKLVSLLLALCLLLGMSGNAFAKSYTGDTVFPGLSGILPGDTLTFPGNTVWATLTASWGVRVTFVDWDETELKTELVPVTDTTDGTSSAPDDPTRDGYTFTGWERHDTNAGPATLNDDGTVTGVNGPGPIVFIATYEKNYVPPVTPVVPVYKVSYVVNGDPVYGLPDDYIVPADSNAYDYLNLVTVAGALTSNCRYATVDGEKIDGTWEFGVWDKEDFNITENTVITGSWKFIPDNSTPLVPDEPAAPEEPTVPDKPDSPKTPKGHAEEGSDMESYREPDSYAGHSDEFWNSLSYAGNDWYEDKEGNRYYYPNGIPKTADMFIDEFGIYLTLLLIALAYLSIQAVKRRIKEKN